MKKKGCKSYKNGGVLGDALKGVADAGLGTFGLDIIPDTAYSNEKIAKAANIAGMLGQVGLSIATAGTSAAATGPLSVASKMTFENGGNLVKYEGGGTHEQNPYGGIPVGNNSTVESGETKWEDYIFSDRLIVPGKKETFAQASKRIAAKYDKRPNDIYSNASKQQAYKELMQSQESERMLFENSFKPRKMALGGNVTGNNPPMKDYDTWYKENEGNYTYISNPNARQTKAKADYGHYVDKYNKANPPAATTQTTTTQTTATQPAIQQPAATETPATEPANTSTTTATTTQPAVEEVVTTPATVTPDSDLNRTQPVAKQPLTAKEKREKEKRTDAAEKAAAAQYQAEIDAGYKAIADHNQNLRENAQEVDDRTMTEKPKEYMTIDQTQNGQTQSQEQAQVEARKKEIIARQAAIRTAYQQKGDQYSGYEFDAEYKALQEEFNRLQTGQSAQTNQQTQHSHGGLLKKYFGGGTLPTKEVTLTPMSEHIPAGHDFNDPLLPTKDVTLNTIPVEYNNINDSNRILAPTPNTQLQQIPVTYEDLQPYSTRGQVEVPEHLKGTFKDAPSPGSSQSQPPVFNDKLTLGEQISTYVPGAVQAAGLIGGIENTKYERYSPNTINLEPQRMQLRKQAANARAIQNQNLRNVSNNAGQYIANSVAGNVGIYDNLGSGLSQSYMTEENANAQIKNQAGMMNTEIGNRQIDANDQNKMAYLKAATDAATSLSSAYRTNAKDGRLYSNNNLVNNTYAGSMQDLFPNYTYQFDMDENGRLRAIPLKYRNPEGE